MEINIKITPATDLNKVLEQLKNYEKRIRKQKNYQKTQLKLDHVQLKPQVRGKSSGHKTIITPVINEDGSISKYRNKRGVVCLKKVNKARFEVYMRMLVNNAFRHPSKSYIAIRKLTNKQFMEEYELTQQEMTTINRYPDRFEEHLNTIGLGKQDIAAMLKEDLSDRKGNRDRLLQIAIGLWDKIEEGKKEKINDKTQDIVDMMKKIVDSQPKAQIIKAIEETKPVEEVTTYEEVKDDMQAIDINQLKEKVGLEKTE